MGRIVNFVKMNGLGNDYIYIDCFRENFTYDDALLYTQYLSNRNFSIGSDGLILIMPSNIADAKMIMFNSDGSEGEMCGNGLRCVSKYIYENTTIKKNILKIEISKRIVIAELFIEKNIVKFVEVNMGSPIFNGLEIPTTIDKELILNEEIIFNNKKYLFTSISMGNPHTIIFLDNIDNLDIESIGRFIEHNKIFPNRTNVEFVEVLNKNEVKQRTWERGTGETLSCGSGASAVCVAGFISGRTNNKIKNYLKGGELYLRYEDNTVFMKGSANYSFHGQIDLDSIKI